MSNYNWNSIDELKLNDKSFKADYLKTELGYFVVQKTKDSGLYDKNKPNEAYLFLFKNKSDIDNFNDNFKPALFTKKLDHEGYAKIMVENTIDYYNKNKNLNINDIMKEYINSPVNNTTVDLGKTLKEQFIKEHFHDNPNDFEIARKAGYVQGVCECVLAVGDDHALCKKLLTEMNVTKEMAQKYANPETFKKLEQGIFAQKQEQTLEQTQTYTR